MRTTLITVTGEDILLGRPGHEFSSPLQYAIRRAFPHLVSIRIQSQIVECYGALSDEVLLSSLPALAVDFEKKFQIGLHMHPITFSMKEPE